jgi:hypothetical protein
MDNLSHRKPIGVLTAWVAVLFVTLLSVGQIVWSATADEELRRSEEEIRRSSAARHELDHLGRDLRTLQARADRDFSALQQAIKNQRAKKPPNWQENVQKLERKILERQKNLDIAMRQRIDKTASPLSRRHANNLIRTGVAPAALSLVFAFFIDDAIGTLNVAGRKDSKFGDLYRAALRGDCAYIRTRVERWEDEMVAELAANRVRGAADIVSKFQNRLRDICRK